VTRYSWRPIFLAVLRTRGRVRLACELSGVYRSTAYDQRHSDAEFRSQWDEAISTYQRERLHEVLSRLEKTA